MAGKVLGLSFDTLASPALSLRPVRENAAAQTSWGLAWYPDDDAVAAVFKDPTDRRNDTLNEAIRRWDRFRSTVFLLCTCETAGRFALQDTQPFVRSFARRDILFAHSGELNGRLKELFPLASTAAYEPVGRTDSERVFCWILEQMREREARTIAEAGWTRVHGWLQQINAHGTADVLLTDGVDVIAYRDVGKHGALGFARHIPPHGSNVLENEDIEIDMSDPRDDHRTHVVFATEPLSTKEWVALEPAQMLVARRGQIVWDSSAAVSSNVPRGTVLQEIVPQESIQKDGGAQCEPTGKAPAGITQSLTSIAENQADGPAGADHRILRVEHETTYTYSQMVESSIHVLRLQPVWDPCQQVLQCELLVSPDGHRHAFEDVFGNRAVQLKVSEAYSEFKIKMSSTVRICAGGPIIPSHERVTVPLVWMPWQRQLMHAYLLPPELPEPQLQELSDYGMSFVERQDYDLVEALRDMNRTMYQDFQYVSGSTTLETTPFEVYANRRGVCQDFANLFICMARLLGVPARYRVGYIYTGANYENKIQSEASHAWVEVYLPTIGWRGFDPTNGCEVGLDHIRVATGRNYRDATPTSGTIFKGGGDETLTVAVKVVDESRNVQG